MNVPEAIANLNPITLSDSRTVEAAKAISTFVVMFITEYGIAAGSLALATMVAHTSPEMSAFIKQAATTGELGVLAVGSVLTLAHGFMAAHP